MQVGSQELYQEAVSSLERIQAFDVDSLPRKSDLGAQLNFGDAVQPATLLVELFQRLSVVALEDFPDNFLKIVLDQANSNYNLFQQALDFTADQQDPRNARQAIVDRIAKAYQPTFGALHPLISYSLHRSADFQRLDTEARATLQSVEDRAAGFADAMQKYSDEAKHVLEEIRNVAAEEGVLKQAAHFRAEAEDHDAKAEVWRTRVVRLAWMLGAFAVVSLFIHKIPFLAPNDLYDSLQLGISKVLIFFVLAYMLFLSARNFLNHRHNAVVNKHRQNALMTHKALVEAAVESGVREAIMIQAASCIFTPQPTGYAESGGDSESPSSKSIIEILSKPLTDSAKTSS